MERLADRGVKFTQAYACAISSPSRCSLMIGMNAARHKVTNWTYYYDQETDMPGGELIIPPDGMSTVSRTLLQPHPTTLPARPWPPPARAPAQCRIHHHPCG